MPAPIRFHLDEHVHPGVAQGLRRRQIDVTTTIDADLLGAEDTDHMTFARTQGRVIVTHDEDYLVLNQQGVSHTGIAYCAQDKYEVGGLLRALLTLWSNVTAEAMVNRVTFL
jgi:hypothetical protein